MKVNGSDRKIYRKVGVLIIAIAIIIPSAISLTRKGIDSFQQKANSNLTFQRVEIEFENIYSNDLKNKISAFTQDRIQGTSLLNFDQNKFYTELKSEFQNIKNFECKINSLVMHIKIVGITPFCLINKNWVLGNKRTLFPLELFDQFNLSSIENFSLNEKNFINPLPKNIYSFIKQIPNKLWNDFEINFIKSTEIYLTPKNSALKYCFVVNQKTINDTPKLEMAAELYNKLMHDEKFIKKFKAKKNHKLVLDVRFKNRIITKLECQTGEGGR